MSNNPNERPIEELCPAAHDAAMDAQAVYRDMLAALAASSKKNGVLLVKSSIHAIMETVGEVLNDEISGEISELREHHCDIDGRPDTHERLISNAAEEVIEHFRLKPIDSIGILTSMLKPPSKERVASFMGVACGNGAAQTFER